jgi:hypothetical protein
MLENLDETFTSCTQTRNTTTHSCSKQGILKVLLYKSEVGILQVLHVDEIIGLFSIMHFSNTSKVSILEVHMAQRFLRINCKPLPSTVRVHKGFTFISPFS